MLTAKSAKCVSMIARYQCDATTVQIIVAESDPHNVRRVAIEVYLLPVLSNIVLQYFSQRSLIPTVERIYNRNKEEVWEFGGKHQDFSCCLSKYVMTEDNKPIHTEFWSNTKSQDNGIIDIRMIFRENQSNTRELLFYVKAPLWDNLDAFTLCRFSRYGSLDSVPFHQYLKFLDDAVAEFQHSVLLNIKSLIDAHKDHQYLVGECLR